MLLRRRKMEEQVLQRHLMKLENENDLIKNHLATLTKVQAVVESEHENALSTLQKKEKEILVPKRQLESLHLEKIRLEDLLLNTIKEQSGLDKAVGHIHLLIREAREKTRKMEMDVAKVENDNSLLAIQVEQLRLELFKKSNLLNEFEKRYEEQEKKVKEVEKDVVQSERIIQRKTQDIDRLNKKIAKVIEQKGVSNTYHNPSILLRDLKIPIHSFLV